MQSISTRKALQACIACVWSSVAASGGTCVAASAYTNHAGHAVSGLPTAITNGCVVISGRSYPLAVFPEKEQARMYEDLLSGKSRTLATAAIPPLPRKLAAMRLRLRERYLRNEALLKAGAKTEADADAQRTRLINFWRHALDADSSLTPAVRDYWASRLHD